MGIFLSFRVRRSWARSERFNEDLPFGAVSLHIKPVITLMKKAKQKIVYFMLPWTKNGLVCQRETSLASTDALHSFHLACEEQTRKCCHTPKLLLPPVFIYFYKQIRYRTSIYKYFTHVELKKLKTTLIHWTVWVLRIWFVAHVGASGRHIVDYCKFFYNECREFIFSQCSIICQVFFNVLNKENKYLFVASVFWFVKF